MKNIFLKKKYSDNLRVLRAVLGMSQADLAKELKVSANAISKIEKGKMPMSLKLGVSLLKLASKHDLHIRLEYFLPSELYKTLITMEQEKSEH